MSEELKDEVVDLYEVIGVKKTATSNEIKSAYRLKVKKLHPDVDGGDEEAFKTLSMAYEVLMDEELRTLYDNTGETEKVDCSERIMSFIQSNVVNNIINAKGFIKVDLIQRINDTIDSNEAQFILSIETSKNKIEKVQFVYDRIKLKEGEDVEDLFHEMLGEKLSDLQSEIKFAHLELVFIESLRTFINRYEYLVETLIGITDKEAPKPVWERLTSKANDKSDEKS
jgi:curved DNA-binding protein CbpA